MFDVGCSMVAFRLVPPGPRIWRFHRLFRVQLLRRSAAPTLPRSPIQRTPHPQPSLFRHVHLPRILRRHRHPRPLHHPSNLRRACCQKRSALAPRQPAPRLTPRHIGLAPFRIPTQRRTPLGLLPFCRIPFPNRLEVESSRHFTARLHPWTLTMAPAQKPANRDLMPLSSLLRQTRPAQGDHPLFSPHHPAAPVHHRSSNPFPIPIPSLTTYAFVGGALTSA